MEAPLRQAARGRLLSRRSRARQLRSRRRRALLGLLALGALAVWLLAPGGGGGARFGQLNDSEVTGAGKPAGLGHAELARALRRGVGDAAALGGSVEAAAMYPGGTAPVVVSSPRGGAGRWMRMWSMGKVVVMVALLRAEGWGEEAGNPLSPEVESALRGAIVRSENCRERRVVLELQQATGAGPAGARRAVAEVLRAAGGRVRPGTQVAPPDPICAEYLEGQGAIEDPLAPAALLGTSTWRIGDAARFLAALRAGAFGSSVAEKVLPLMRAPKSASREVPPGELTAPLEWGAGEAFSAGPPPAYKAGWGGTQQAEFLAGQIALVQPPSGPPLALAVAFHPHVQPASDDPGRTEAPDGVELVMDAVRAEASPSASSSRFGSTSPKSLIRRTPEPTLRRRSQAVPGYRSSLGW